jgi:LysM repeat protein
MKPTLLLATLSMVFLAPNGYSKTEVEKLRELVVEQERQIRMLEDENMKLRSQSEAPSFKATPSTTLITNRPVEVVERPAPVANQGSYTVTAGDNLVKIARKTNTTPEALARANGLKTGALIHPGQKLKLPGAAQASAPSSESKTHTVQSGETFFSISRKYKISTDALITANPETKPSALRPGQKIRIASANSTPASAAPKPKPQPTSVAAKAEEKPKLAPSPAPAPAADPISPPQSAASAATPTKQPVIRSVMIDGEMTYGQFAAKHGTNPDRLNELNGLDLTAATVLAKGSELYVAAQP